MLNSAPLNTGPINALESGGAFVDWSASIDPATSQTYYALEVIADSLSAVRIPISSWQATIQAGRASYAQAVIPAAVQWVDTIEDRSDGEFIVYRGVRFANGETQESTLARAPIQQINLDRGPINVTMRVSGYATIPGSAQALVRTLRNVRSQSVSSAGTRVRCDIDWFLRPGHTAIALDSEIAVAYINYYVNDSDEYMDVGERAS